jgi:hypothetical protein
MNRALELSTLSEQEALELALKESASMLTSFPIEQSLKINGDGDADGLGRADVTKGGGVSFAEGSKTYNGRLYCLAMLSPTSSGSHRIRRSAAKQGE